MRRLTISNADAKHTAAGYYTALQDVSHTVAGTRLALRGILKHCCTFLDAALQRPCVHVRLSAFEELKLVSDITAVCYGDLFTAAES